MGLAESKGSLPSGLDQLRNPTLGNRVWSACTFLVVVVPALCLCLRVYIFMETAALVGPVERMPF